MSTRVSAHCLLHAHRESVARCPECRQSYCRECITEHEGRVICAACLRRLTRPEAPARRRFRVPWQPLPVLAGWLVAWGLFYLLGRVLLEIPGEWHEGIPVLQRLLR